MRDCGFARRDLCVEAKTPEKAAGYRLPVEQRFSAKNLARMLRRLEGSNHFRVAAILSAGSVRLEAVVYWDNGKYSLGYDLLVKDTPFSPDWICYENLPDPVRYDVRNLEREMFQVLDRAVKKYDLSFTECRFPKLDGSSGKRK